MMVIFLVGLVLVILLRNLKNDFTRYDRKDGFSDLVCIFYFYPLFSGVAPFSFLPLNRKGILETSMGGSRSMATCSVVPPTLPSWLRSWEPGRSLSSLSSLSLSTPSWETFILSTFLFPHRVVLGLTSLLFAHSFFFFFFFFFNTRPYTNKKAANFI